MSEQELAAIRARAEAATDGPWQQSMDITGRLMVVVNLTPHQFREIIIAVSSDNSPRDEDLDFIAHAREDVPALLAEVERLREALAVVVADCPICGGTGRNRDAMQAWDVPDAPVPDCHYCAPLRAALEATVNADSANHQ